MIPRQLLNYPEQLAKRLSDMEREIDKLKRELRNYHPSEGGGSGPSQEVNDGLLTIQQNGTTIGTFTADQATNTTVNVTTMTGATSSVAGAAGLVPAPTTSDPDKYLKGDGTWDSPSIPVDSSYSITNLPTHTSGTTTYTLYKMGNLALLNAGYIWYSGTFSAGNWESLGSVPADLYPSVQVHTTATVTNGSTGQVVTYGPMIIETTGEIKFKPMNTLSSGLYGYSFQATWLL